MNARPFLRKLPLIVLGLALAGALVYSFRPQPVAIDAVAVVRGPLQVTVDEEGKTRIKERYIVSSPLAGQLLRIDRHAGDQVAAGKTLITAIEPTDPGLLDIRALAQAEARIKAAEAAKARALPLLEEARAAYTLAEQELGRAGQLRAKGVITQSDFDTIAFRERSAGAQLRSAQFAVQIAEFELQLAQAALLRTQPRTGNTPDSWRFEILSPVDGRVLRVFQESATVVSAGTPLVELGNPADLEVEVDVLSTDAVKIAAGAKVQFEHWGGTPPLNGRVRLVEPAAFTKVSALGVEEQRVKVVIDFVDPPESWKALGDAYRVEARIVIWEQDDVMKIPAGALFRHADGWAVFAIEAGRATLRPVRMGRNNGLEAEVLEGLRVGERVILHPSDKIRPGRAIAPRAD